MHLLIYHITYYSGVVNGRALTTVLERCISQLNLDYCIRGMHLSAHQTTVLNKRCNTKND